MGQNTVSMGTELHDLPQNDLVLEVIRLQERVASLVDQREILQGELLKLHKGKNGNQTKKGK